MRIAVISDIHGNIQALESVLNNIEQEECDKILCLGDLAMAGPEPQKAVEIIKKLYDDSKLELIQGNTDEMIAHAEISVPVVKEKFPVMGNALENDAQILSEKLKFFLNSLPKQKELIIEGVKVLMVHGSPRKNDENITPDLSAEQIEEIIKDTNADLILCGHTHVPCGYQTNSKQTVVNVGSVGRPFTPQPDACFALFNFNNGEFEVEHKFVDYNREKAATILAKRDFEGSEKLANILIKPEFRHI